MSAICWNIECSLSWAKKIPKLTPAGTGLRKISDERIKTVEEYLNFRPIRKFDYLNPIQQTLKHRAASVALMT